MKWWRLSLALIVTGLLAATALADNGPKLTSRDGRLQITLPGGYQEKTPAKPTIKIEADNPSANATILVLSESQRQFASLAEYAEKVRDDILGRLRDAQSNGGEKIEAGGNPAIRYEITGISAAGNRLAFLVTVIQTENRFNQVVGSCPRADFAANQAQFIAAADSLKEIAKGE